MLKRSHSAAFGGGAPLKASNSKGLRRIDTVEVNTEEESLAYQDVVTRTNDEQITREPLQRDVVIPDKNLCHAEGAQATEASHNLEKRSFANAQDDTLFNISANKTKISNNFRKKVAFTLTEVLLAVLIVGIIAAIVLPAIITKYQDKVLDSAYKREVHSIQDSIDSLAAVENKESFYETTLATDTESYMKKYLRVSKYCKNGKDCFGKYYSKYTDNEKKTYTQSYDGSCAILKNGTSVCLNVNGGNVDMLIDVNGPKGPNVLGRDLRTYSYSVRGKTGYNMSPSGIIAINQEPIKDNGTDDPCEGMTCGCGDLPACDPCAGKICGCGDLPDCCTSSDTTLNCCKKRSIKGESDPCCKWSYYDNDKTCHPCPVKGSLNLPNIGCVYVLTSFSPVLHDTQDIWTWDYDVQCYLNNGCGGSVNKRIDSYWGGARKACVAIGMNLPSIDKLKSIAQYSNSHSNIIPSGSYWSSVGKNGDGDVLAAMVVSISGGKSGSAWKYKSDIKALCIGN